MVTLVPFFCTCSVLIVIYSLLCIVTRKIRHVCDNFQLSTESLTITTGDVTQVLLDVVRENVCGSLTEINKTTAQRAGELKADIDKLEVVTSTSLNDILSAKETAIVEIERANLKTVAEINELKESTIQEIKTKVSEVRVERNAALEDVRSSAEKTKIAIKQDIQKRKLEAAAEIKDLEQASLKKIKQTASRFTRLTDADYEHLKTGES